MPAISSYFALKMQSEERAASNALGTSSPSYVSDKHTVGSGKAMANGTTAASTSAALSNAPPYAPGTSEASVSPSPKAPNAASPSRFQGRHRPSFSVTIPSLSTVKVATPPRTAMPHTTSSFGMPTPGPSQPRRSVPPRDYTSDIPAPVHSQIMSNQWHTMSDHDMALTVSQLASDHAAESPADDVSMSEPYHSTIRVLSSALQKLNDQYLELEQQMRRREELYSRRRGQAERRVRALKPPPREDLARRILDAVFDTDDRNGDPGGSGQEVIMDGPAIDDTVSSPVMIIEYSA